MEEKDCCLKDFLQENGFVTKKKVIGIVYGKAKRRDVYFETSISFHEETKKYKVIGHGTGDYSTLEEVAIAIKLPETRGRGKGNAMHIKRSISFSTEEQNNLQAAANRHGMSFSAYVRNSALNAASSE